MGGGTRTLTASRHKKAKSPVEGFNTSRFLKEIVDRHVPDA